MASTTLSQVWNLVPMALSYVRNWFSFDDSTAADVIQDVLLRLFRSGPEELDRPNSFSSPPAAGGPSTSFEGDDIRDKTYGVLARIVARHPLG